MTHAEMVDNILNVFDLATPQEYAQGMGWYINANGIAWGLDHINYKRAAGVIAALSPLLSWDKNVEYAKAIMAGANDAPCLKKNVAKAIAIRDGWNPLDILSGIKVTSFYQNIINPYSDDIRHVTIDKHAHDIAINDMNVPYKGSSVSKGKYLAIAAAYIEAANDVDILPLQMQAVTWTAWRNMKRGK